MYKVFISNTTFAQFSDLPIKLLTDNNFRIMVNPIGRKFRSEEIIESVDMMRIFENGYKVHMANTNYNTHVVDTVEDLNKVERLLTI